MLRQNIQSVPLEDLSLDQMRNAVCVGVCVCVFLLCPSSPSDLFHSVSFRQRTSILRDTIKHHTPCGWMGVTLLFRLGLHER